MIRVQLCDIKSVEEDNDNEIHYFDAKESIRSSNKETNTNAGTSHEGNVTNSAKVFKSKGNEETQTASDAGFHQLPAVSAVEEKASDNKSSENNYLKQSRGKNIVPDTNDLTSEPEQENAPKMNLIKPEGGSDVDPFPELESILLGSPESSPKATNATVQEALHNLECLLENSLESIFSDDELQLQLHTSLECLKLQAYQEKVSPNVVKLVQKMKSTIENIFEDFAMTKKVVEDHINILQQKEKLVQLMRDAKKQQESKQKEKSQFEDEVKHLKEDSKKLDEKIRNLVEQKKSIELKETKLKESMERCEGEKKKVEDEAMNMITEIEELLLSIKNSKSSYAAALS
ncbi:disease resistance protein [Trifolium medium]|uniref:Disease resistance protein n=1 Tax=Trifolium medium TaxID=97028 RepID=A0A392LYV0_9FABA|nr:disease resistance protein [Trifolium medium]